MKEQIALIIDELTNIEYSLFLNLKGVATVRVRDLDANENYSLIQYPTLEAAKTAFHMAYGLGVCKYKNPTI